ncbi:MAG: carboxymuconolactone decarboxylase family protein [Thermoleophilia bacterium]
MNRREIGLQEFSRATGGRGPLATERVREASRVLADGVDRFIFADVFSHSGLGSREREMITVTVLAAIGGADNQLGVHVPAALECGADPEELLQLCEQIAPYCGFPRALNALRAVRGVLEERGIALPPPPIELELEDHGALATSVGTGGSGLLLLHSPETDRRVWRDVIAALPAGTRAVAPDLRGLGSAAGAPHPAELATLVDDLSNVLDACELSRVRLVTLGATASLGVALAIADQERVKDLVLVAPAAGHTGIPPGPESLATQLMPTTLAVNGWGARYARDRLERLDVDGWTNAERVFAGADLWVAPQPTRVVDGMYGDHVTSTVAAETWGVEPVTYIPDASRLVPLEAPADLVEVLSAS